MIENDVWSRPFRRQANPMGTALAWISLGLHLGTWLRTHFWPAGEAVSGLTLDLTWIV